MVPAVLVLPMILASAVPPTAAASVAGAAFVRAGPAVSDRGFGALRADPSRVFQVPLGRASAAAMGSACTVPDACMARVEIPGQQSAAFRTPRSELVLALLSHSPFEPVASLASRLAALNFRVTYLPPRRGVDPGGWGQVLVSLRWRLDANGPADVGR
jgi:hypothetical protein